MPFVRVVFFTFAALPLMAISVLPSNADEYVRARYRAPCAFSASNIFRTIGRLLLAAQKTLICKCAGHSTETHRKIFERGFDMTTLSGNQAMPRPLMAAVHKLSASVPR